MVKSGKVVVRGRWLSTALLVACSSPETDPRSMSAGSSAGAQAAAGGTDAGARGGAPTAGGAGRTTGGASDGGESGGPPSSGGAAGAPHGGGNGPITPITGPPGVWENVSPVGHPELFDMNDPSCSGCNYGTLGVVADRAHSGVLYTSFCYHGVWKSTDWGITWAKVSEEGGPMDNGGGRLTIAPDGSYMIAWALYPRGGYQNAAWITTDGGVTFTQYDLPIPDPILFEINWNDKTRVVAANHEHDINHFWESTDSGHTWTDQGSIFEETSLGSPAIHWLDDDTLLAVDDGDAGDGAGTYRGVRSGSTWPWSWSWTKVSNQQHFHGYHQIFQDPDSEDIVYNGGAFGLERSTDKGLTWTHVSDNYSSVVVGTGTKLYSTANYATGGEFGPWLMTADRSNGTTWKLWDNPASPGRPEGMTNGFGWAAAGFDGERYVIVTGNWLAGIWRYVEP